MTHYQRFRRKDRLQTRAAFARVFAERCSKGDGRLVVYVASNGLPFSRLGLSVSKRAGKAVRRNYIRRRIRESFRISKADLPQGLDIVCVARAGADSAHYDIARAFHSMLAGSVKRLSLLSNKEQSTDKPSPPKTPRKQG
ncbi:MAG: ribonuclease P protein component [Phycisphaerales bacterium]|nr:MAG: ribonuclease P protein component [Phycisphaerales bacterium]